jgi:hypothetical protein
MNGADACACVWVWVCVVAPPFESSNRKPLAALLVGLTVLSDDSGVSVALPLLLPLFGTSPHTQPHKHAHAHLPLLAFQPSL